MEDSTPSSRVRHEILWGRFEESELLHRKAWQKFGYFGHTPVPTYAGRQENYTPIVAEKMALLDTAAALSPAGKIDRDVRGKFDDRAIRCSRKACAHSGGASRLIGMAPSTMNLVSHHLKIAVLQPQIAPNTGNIARLCVATGTELHLVRPLGFVLSDRNLRRSAMDYWPRLKLTVHDDTNAFINSAGDARLWFFSSHGSRPHWEANFGGGDFLVFGSETKGIDADLRDRNADRVLRIPQAADERCLNLSTAAGIALYEAPRQVQMTR